MHVIHYLGSEEMHEIEWQKTNSCVDTSHCEKCGEHVTPQFSRVFGDNDDTVHGYVNCSTYRGLT